MIIRIYQWALLLLAGIGLSGCVGMTPTATPTVAAATVAPLIPTDTPIPVPAPTSTPVATTETMIVADEVLTPDQAQQVATVQVGQIINHAAATDLEPVVSYRPDILLALPLEEAM